MTLNGLPEEYLMMGEKSEIGDEMLDENHHRTWAPADWKTGTVDPAVPLVVHGIGTLQVEKAAVLRFERGLQVGCVVNGMDHV